MTFRRWKAKQVRVLYGLQDLAPDSAPCRIVPCSCLSFHNDANPCLRYQDHPERVMVVGRVRTVCAADTHEGAGSGPIRCRYLRTVRGRIASPCWDKAAARGRVTGPPRAQGLQTLGLP